MNNRYDGKWIYANENHSTIINEKDGVIYITFPLMVKAGLRHGFSTRFGGVSSGNFASMNLSYTRGDDEKHVTENFRRIGKAIGFPHEKLVLSSQVHGTVLRKVTSKDCGDGILRPTVPGIDGLVTDERDVPMYTSYADCVPLLFYDPVQNVTAMAHSGWRGTVQKIGEKMIRYMEAEYESKVSDILCVIGPSICRSCYEVSTEVMDEFRRIMTEEQIAEIADDKQNGHYQLDLWKANEIILLGAGIVADHLQITDLCTCCNHEKLFSHRASHGKRGNLGCFTMIS